jgi:hypothetical protein
MINRDQDVVHPVGCMCQECIEAREEEEIQQPVAPPVKTPVRPRGRPRKNGSTPQQAVYPDTYTQPVAPPTHAHARYTYAYGEMRRCHLCGAQESHMNYENGDEPTWFASLEDRARHILEVHTDAENPIVKMERRRAKEILGIKDVWDRHSPAKTALMGTPIMEEPEYQPEQPKKSLLSNIMKSKPTVNRSSNWFMEHKLITGVLIIVILYGLYVMYLLSQGYEF